MLDTDAALAEPAVESYLRVLQEERDKEAAALAGARDGGVGSGGGDSWALDPTLLRRMAAVRDAERGLIVQVRQRRCLVCVCVPTGEPCCTSPARVANSQCTADVDAHTLTPALLSRSCCTCWRSSA